MNEGLLNLDVITDGKRMRELVGEELVNAFVIGINGNIFYSMNSEDIGRSAGSVPQIDAKLLTPSLTTPLVRQDEQQGRVFALTPLFGADGRNNIWLFVVGSLAVVLSTSLVILVAFNRIIFNPLQQILSGLRLVEAGDLTTQLTRATTRDELGDLARAFNHMALQLRQNMENLRKERDLVARIMETSPVGITLINREGSITFANARTEQLLGLTRDMITGLDVNALGWRISDYDGRPFPDEILPFRQLMQTEQPIYDVRCAIEPSDGQQVLLSINGAPLLDESGRVESVILTLEDITSRKRAEEALIQSRIFLDKIINTIPDPIFVKDRQHCWVLLNDALCTFKGYERQELLGKSDYAFFPEKEADIFWDKDEEVFTSGVGNINEESFTDANKVTHTIITTKTLYVNDKGEKHIVGIIRDVTEQRRLEEQLRQAAKMEAVGTLAGGVAHDFNNILTVILGHSDMALQRAEIDGNVTTDLQQIRMAGQRAAALTSQLLAFSRKQVVQPKVLNLNEVMVETEKMLRRLLGEDIDLVSVPDPGLAPVMADHGLIEQVIMNLAINARDAMPRGGKLTIETANVYLDEQYHQQHLDVEPGCYVLLAISDTGTGMDEATLLRVFEPFFTTKARGKGTGLGLAVVYGIVKQSGGHIWVYSEPGSGTTFKVYLPAFEQEVELLTTGHDADQPLRGGSETILVVEDDESVLDLASKILRNFGYTVLEAHDGHEALKMCREYDGPMHILVTDVVMPSMNGRKLARKIEALRSEMKVLYISGYTDNAIVHHGVLDAGTAFLQKPFTSESLARKVREVIDS